MKLPTVTVTSPIQYVAVVGSRGYPRLDLVESFVWQLPVGTVLVSGGAKGVDDVAERAHRKIGGKVIIYYPDWDKHGRAAGFIRNRDIVHTATEVVAFWDLVSNGTASSIDLALEWNKPIQVFGPDGELR